MYFLDFASNMQLLTLNDIVSIMEVISTKNFQFLVDYTFQHPTINIDRGI